MYVLEFDAFNKCGLQARGGGGGGKLSILYIMFHKMESSGHFHHLFHF